MYSVVPAKQHAVGFGVGRRRRRGRATRPAPAARRASRRRTRSTRSLRRRRSARPDGRRPRRRSHARRARRRRGRRRRAPSACRRSTSTRRPATSRCRSRSSSRRGSPSARPHRAGRARPRPARWSIAVVPTHSRPSESHAPSFARSSGPWPNRASTSPLDEELDPIGQRDDHVAVDGRVRAPDHGVELLDRVRAVEAVERAALDVDPGQDAVVEPRALREPAPHVGDYL